MRLVGKKLYRVAPLKCFKGSTGGGGGGGGGGGSTPQQKKKIKTMPTNVGPGPVNPNARASGQTDRMSGMTPIGPGPVSPGSRPSGAPSPSRSGSGGSSSSDIIAEENRRREAAKRKAAVEKAKAEAEAKAEAKRREEEQRQKAKAKAEAMAKAARIREQERLKQEAKEKAKAVSEGAKVGRARELDDLANEQIDEQERKKRAKEFIDSLERDKEIAKATDELRKERLQIDEQERKKRAKEFIDSLERQKELDKIPDELRKERGKEFTDSLERDEEIAKATDELRKERLQEKEAEETLRAKEREDEETVEGIKRGEERRKRQSLLAEKAEKDMRLKQAQLDYEKGIINAEQYIDFLKTEDPRYDEFGKIPKGNTLTRRKFFDALKFIDPTDGDKLVKALEDLNKKLSSPTSPTEATEELAGEAEEKAKAKGDGQPTIAPPPPSPAPRPSSEPSSPPVAAAPVSTPDSKPVDEPDAKPVEQMSPNEVGESIVKKEAKMIRERSLAQQLAQIRGLRGVSPGQKMRLLQRSQERFDREFAPKVQLAIMKERETRRQEQLGLSEAQKERDLRLEMAKLKGTGSVSLSKSDDRPQFLKDLADGATAIGTTLDILDDLDIDLSDLNPFSDDDEEEKAEGGFVSGPGTEMSDSIPARLSDGEFVIRASAVRGIGKAMGAEGKDEERKKGVNFLYKLQDKMHKIEKAKISKQEKQKLLKGLGKELKFAKGGEAYSRPKKAFKEAIGYESESRFYDKAFKDTKDGGAKRKFRHFQMGGDVDMKGPGVVKDQFEMPTSGYGAVVSAQGDLMRRIEELERKVGK